MNFALANDILLSRFCDCLGIFQKFTSKFLFPTMSLEILGEKKLRATWVVSYLASWDYI